MDATALLSLKALCAWYTRSQPVLSGLSMDLGVHEVVGLIGLNGSGKTTFIKTLSGLHSSYRIASAQWRGNPLSFRDRGFKLVRYTVFAEDHAFRYFTFREYLGYVMTSYGIPTPDVAELVRGFHFEEYTDVLLKELSSGNLKKAYLITAFALQPALLLLDEPVNGLDFQSTEYLYRLINDYREYGTILFSSHILESICLTSDRVLVLENGVIGRTFCSGEFDATTIREALHHECQL